MFCINTRLAGLLISEAISITLVTLVYIFYHLGSHIPLNWLSNFLNNYTNNLENLNTTDFYINLQSNFSILENILIIIFTVYIGSKFLVLLLFCFF